MTLQADVWHVDDFIPDIEQVRWQGINANFQDRVLKDGALYKRVAEAIIPSVVDALSVAMGRPITLDTMGFRLNYAGELPNQAIHTDTGWGTYAMTLCLDPHAPAGNGTAFWTHTATGLEGVELNDYDAMFSVADDANHPDAFDLRLLAEAKYNRATIYRSDLLHSRYPFTAYGSTPADGRLTLVAFFS